MKKLYWKAFYDYPQRTLGRWRKGNPPAGICAGLDATSRIFDAIECIPTPKFLAQVEVGGKIIQESHPLTCQKMRIITCQKMRIIRAWKWGKRDSAALAVFAAELTLENFKCIRSKNPLKAIEAAKAYLSNPTEKNQAVAESAARVVVKTFTDTLSDNPVAAMAVAAANRAALAAASDIYAAGHAVYAVRYAALSARYKEEGFSRRHTAEAAVFDAVESWLQQRVETLEECVMEKDS